MPKQTVPRFWTHTAGLNGHLFRTGTTAAPASGCKSDTYRSLRVSFSFMKYNKVLEKDKKILHTCRNADVYGYLIKSIDHSMCLLKHSLATHIWQGCTPCCSYLQRVDVDVDLYWVMSVETASSCDNICNGWLHKSHFSEELTRSVWHAPHVTPFLGSIPLTCLE